MTSPQLHKLAALAIRALMFPELAAKELVKLGVSPDFMIRLMDFAPLTDADLESFDKEGKSYLIRLPSAGHIWLAPVGKKRVLLPPAPTFSPRALRALARGLVEVAA